LNPPDIALGARLFAQHCTACHGVGGRGDGPLVTSKQLAVAPPDFTNPETIRRQTPGAWFTTITAGRIEKFMPPWKDKFSEAERWAVALYTYTLSYPNQINLGREVWTAHCAECHGEMGKGDGPKAKDINRPLGNLIVQSEISSLSDDALYASITEGIGQTMPAFADKLTEPQRRAAAAYARTLSLANPDAIGKVVEVAQAATPAATPEPATTAEANTITSTVRGTASGRITNGTAGGSVPPDLKVTVYVSAQNNIQRFETTSGADGTFSVKAVPILADANYIAAALYRDRLFTSAFVSGDVAKPALDLPINIYDLTEDAAVISLTGLVAQINATNEGLEVRQALRFRNSSDRAFTSSQNLGSNRFPSVVIPLPPGAQVLTFDDSQRYEVSQDKFTVVDTAPVMPGDDHLVVIVYLLPYDNKGAVIEQPVNYALDGQVRLLLWPESLSVTSDQLAARGPETLSNRTYQSYGATLTLPAGSAIRYELKGGLAAAATTGGAPSAVTGSNLVVITLLLIAVVLIGLGLALFLRNRGAARQDRDKLIDALVRQIAELDDQHKAGQLNHDLWHHQRAQLKARLTELLGETQQRDE
jgi:mono/diheme cytochrome c family protein